jgi:hypothetical protein
MAALAGSASAGFDLTSKLSDAKKTKLTSVTGVIKSVNKGTLSVATVAAGGKQTQVVEVAMDNLTQIKGTGKKNPSYGDLLPGKPVRVDYTENNGAKTARVITMVTPKAEGKAPAK